MAGYGEYKVKRSDIDSAIQHFLNSGKEKFSKDEFCTQVGASLSAVSNAISHHFDMTYEEFIFSRMPKVLTRRPQFQGKNDFLVSLCKSIADFLDKNDDVDRFRLTKTNIDSKISGGSLGRLARKYYPDAKDFKSAVLEWFDKERPDLKELIVD